MSCLEKNKANLSASCQEAVNAAGGGASQPRQLVLRRMQRPPAPQQRPRARRAGVAANAAAGSAFRPEVGMRRGCSRPLRDVPPGGGRIIQCLAARAASLSPALRGYLAPVRGAVRRRDARSETPMLWERTSCVSPSSAEGPEASILRISGKGATRTPRSICSNRMPPARPGVSAWCSPNRRWNSCAPTTPTRSTRSRRGWRAGRISRSICAVKASRSTVSASPRSDGSNC